MSSSSEDTSPYEPLPLPLHRSHSFRSVDAITGAPLPPSGFRDPFAKATNFRRLRVRRPAPVAAAHPAPTARASTPPQAPPAQERAQSRDSESLSDSEEELPPIPPGHPFRRPPRRIRGARNHAELQLAYERREGLFNHQASRRRIRELTTEMDALEAQRAAEQPADSAPPAHADAPQFHRENSKFLDPLHDAPHQDLPTACTTQPLHWRTQLHPYL